MLNFLLPLAYKVVDAAVAKIPDDAELGEKLIDLCLLIVGKAVKLTKTTADDGSSQKSKRHCKHATNFEGSNCSPL